jgi:uncharacterized phage protein (TIGR02220 family)
MAMDWANERYVRVYTRDTTTWKLLDWRAKALLPLLLRKLNRAGVLEVGEDGELGLAAQVELPIEVVEPGIAQLLARGVVAKTATAYVVPKYLDAQEAVQTTAHRSKEYRSRLRDAALETGNTVTKRDAPVTKRDDTVTSRHVASHGVTPILSEPILAEPKPGDVSTKSTSPAKSRVKAVTDTEQRSVRVVLDRLSDRSRVKYRGGDQHTALIVGRLRNGYTEWDLRRVIAYCAEVLEWEGDPKMQQFLRPETLFGPTTIAKYIDAARTWLPGDTPPDEPPEEDQQGPVVLFDAIGGPDSPDHPRWEEPSWMS